MLLAGKSTAVELLARIVIDVLLVVEGTTVMIVERDSVESSKFVVGMLLPIFVTQVVVVTLVCNGADEVERY